MKNLTVTRPPSMRSLSVKEEPQVEYLQVKRPARKVRLVVPKWLYVSMVIVPLLGISVVMLGFFGLPKLSTIGDKLDKLISSVRDLTDSNARAEKILARAEEASAEAQKASAEIKQFREKAESALEAIQSFPLRAARRNPEYLALQAEKEAREKELARAKALVSQKAAEAARLRTAFKAGEEEKLRLASELDSKKNEVALLQQASDDDSEYPAPGSKKEFLTWARVQLGLNESTWNWEAVGPPIVNRKGEKLINPKTGKAYRAYGFAQIHEKYLPERTLKFCEAEIAPKQFLKNHTCQVAVIMGMLEEYYDQCPEDRLKKAACIHRKWIGPNAGPTVSDGNKQVWTYVLDGLFKSPFKRRAKSSSSKM